MSNKPEPLKILSNNTTLFDTDTEYIIPLYQRAFAWEEKQLTQLIEDICDIPEDTNYYMGSLIVYKQDDKYEVVDGQQRLTSLFLLLNCLNCKIKKSISFACRKKADYTLEHVKDYIHNQNNIEISMLEPNIARGIDIINNKLHEDNINVDLFKTKLEQITIYRIELPENTNLNRYFEIMNTRGEQLEQHDILKASLMRDLPYEEQTIFSKIWNACSDMTGYVQMHFDTIIREAIFGCDWKSEPSNIWSDYVKLPQSSSKSEKNSASKSCEPRLIKEIIKDYEEVDYEETDEENTRVRFESIIDFPFFLLHVLKVCILVNGIVSKDQNYPLTDELLDDKKLCDSFERVINYGLENGHTIKENKNDFSRKFIVCLLKSRFLFDKYIIKREYRPDNDLGRWGLWSIKGVADKKFGRSKRPQYSDTLFVKSRQHDTTNSINNKSNVMLQSALRISYTSQKSMHWITKLLSALSTDSVTVTDYCSFTENILKDAVNTDFFAKCKIESYDPSIFCLFENAKTDRYFTDCQNGPYGSFALGVSTPNIVFNYLDYLIWKNNSCNYKDFVFEFRTSVEHWYPRNPSSDNIDKWEGGGVDQFGNLCIVSSSVNSRFSNNPPSAKAESFKNTINKNSLKLQKMSALTKEIHDDYRWRQSEYKKHEIKMLKILMDACGQRMMPIFYKDNKYDAN